MSFDEDINFNGAAIKLGDGGATSFEILLT